MEQELEAAVAAPQRFAKLSALPGYSGVGLDRSDLGYFPACCFHAIYGWALEDVLDRGAEQCSCRPLQQDQVRNFNSHVVEYGTRLGPQEAHWHY